MTRPPDPSNPSDTAGDRARPAARAMAGTVAALSAGEIAGRLVAFGTTAVLARRLGPEGLGMLGFAWALTSYFALAVGSGLNDLGMREVAHRPHAAAAIYRTVLAIRLPSALVALAVLVLVSWWLPGQALRQQVVAVSGLSLLALAIDPAWAVKALGRPALAAAAAVAAQLLVLSGVALFVLTPDDVLKVPVLQFGGEAIVALGLLALTLGVPAAPAARSEGLALWRESLPLLAGRSMRAVIVSFDVVLLGFIATSHEVGIYAAVYRLHFFVLALGMAVQTAYLPPLARAAVHGRPALARVSAESLSGAALVAAPLVAGGMIVAGPLLAFLFGVPYAEGASALRWLLVSLAFVFVHGQLHNVYVVTGRAHLEARWFAAAAIVNVAANLWLIPRFGIAGAAAATALAEGVILAGGVLVARLAAPATLLAVWTKPACAAALMAAAVWAAGSTLPVPALCALGAAVYCAAIVGLIGPRAAAEKLGFQLP